MSRPNGSAARLTNMLPGDLNHVFFADSGSVAVEVAMKMAVQYWLNRGAAGRNRFLAFRGGYHGDTLGAMSVCDPEDSMHAHFDGWLPGQIFADLPRDAERTAALEALLAECGGEIAAVIIEPLVQGAGGMRFHNAETWRHRGMAPGPRRLLIADEIFTGFGRVGSMFACEQADVVPDIICLSKAITGGTMALAATVARRRCSTASGRTIRDGAHAWPDLHGKSARVRGRQCFDRSVRTGTAS